MIYLDTVMSMGMAIDARRGFTFFLVVAASALLLVNQTHAAVSTHFEIEDLESAPPDFSYSGNSGPDKWGKLSPYYAACSKGKSQSPINIVRKQAVLNKKLKPLRRDYHAVNATLINHGFNIGLFFGNAGPLIVDGKSYNLQQMHWHLPSEHQFDGVIYDAELHLVHWASDGNVSVIAILYKIGDADPIVSEIQNKLAELAEEAFASHQTAQVSIGIFDTLKLRRNTHKYYRYVGSFTTPPCTENVLWHIFPRVRSISNKQVEALKAPLLSMCKRNCRPLQPLNGRKVDLFNELS